NNNPPPTKACACKGCREIQKCPCGKMCKCQKSLGTSSGTSGGYVARPRRPGIKHPNGRPRKHGDVLLRLCKRLDKDLALVDKWMTEPATAKSFMGEPALWRGLVEYSSLLKKEIRHLCDLHDGQVLAKQIAAAKDAGDDDYHDDDRDEILDRYGNQ